MKTSPTPIPFAGSILNKHRHVCGFFASRQEEYEMLLPFVREGLRLGERAYHVLRSAHRENHLEYLTSAGIDIDAAQRRHQLEVATVEETYLRAGRFNSAAMLELIQETLRSGTVLGFPLTRFIAHVAERVLEDWSNGEAWIRYEAQLNEVLSDFDDPVICVYDTNRINGSIAVDVLRTHPVAIVGGLLYENPFFVEARQFLRELQQRGSA